MSAAGTGRAVVFTEGRLSAGSMVVTTTDSVPAFRVVVWDKTHHRQLNWRTPYMISHVVNALKTSRTREKSNSEDCNQGRLPRDGDI